MYLKRSQAFVAQYRTTTTRPVSLRSVTSHVSAPSIEELRTCRDRTASGRADRIDHGRCIIRVGSVVDDDRGAGLHDAPGNPGDDATGRPGHHARLVRRATGSAASVTAVAGSGRWR